MKMLHRIITVAAATLALAAPVLVTAQPASAASRDGVCNSGEFCYYYNSGEAGAISDFTGSLSNYGTTEPSCYDFKAPGAGAGTCIKNNAASVWNRSGETVRVYYNSGYEGSYQDFAPGAKGNLNATLKNNNASHQFLSSSGGSCNSGFGDPNTCGQAVAWAKAHETTTYHADYYDRCDHVMALAYGWSASGSTTAYNHWLAVPAADKHAGDRERAGRRPGILRRRRRTRDDLHRRRRFRLDRHRREWHVHRHHDCHDRKPVGQALPRLD